MLVRCDCGVSAVRRLADLVDKRSERCVHCARTRITNECRARSVATIKRKAAVRRAEREAAAQPEESFVPPWAADRSLLPKSPPGRKL